MIEVTIIPILEDNYAYLLTADNGETAIVDPGEAQPVIDVLKAKNRYLDYIFNTHHHGDHIAGNAALQKEFGAKIAAPASEQARIQNIDIPLSEGTDFSFGGEVMKILETPGHTRGHICLYFPESKIVFTADALFSMGCGRLFEGTAEQMWASLQKLMALPDETKVYCGHEYTLSNGKFCQTLEPDNEHIKKRMEEVAKLRSENKPTLPSSIGLEKKTNSFLRAGSAQKFAEIRILKDKS